MSRRAVNGVGGQVHRVVSTSLPFRLGAVHAVSTTILFHRENVGSGTHLVRDTNVPCASCCRLSNCVGCFCNYLAPSANCVRIFSLIPCFSNILLHIPREAGPARLRPIVHRSGVFRICGRRLALRHAIKLSGINSLGQTVRGNVASRIIVISRTVRRGRMTGVTRRVTTHCSGNIHVILVSKPSSSKGAAFYGQLRIRLVAGLVRPIKLSLSSCFLGHRSAPGSRSNRCSFRSLCTLSLPCFGDRLRGLLSNRRVRIPDFGFRANHHIFGKGGLGVRGGSILIVRNVRTLGPRLASVVRSYCGCQVCMSILASVSLSGRG